MDGILSCGFAYRIEPAALDDWELLELLQRVDGGDMLAIGAAFRLMLGDEQYSRLKNALRKDGRVKASDMVAAFMEIMAAQNAAKKD